MSGLPWVRLDRAFFDHPKFLALAERSQWQAITSYLASLSYAGAAGTDGFVPGSALRLLHGTAATARRLVEVRLWEEVPNGWQIHDWDHYQVSREHGDAARQKGRKAACRRWHGEGCRCWERSLRAV